jgi:hemolysin activation/secretion protein
MKRKLIFCTFFSLTFFPITGMKGAQVSEPKIPSIASSGMMPDNSSSQVSYGLQGGKSIPPLKIRKIPMKGRKLTLQEQEAKEEESTVIVNRLTVKGLSVYSQETVQEIFKPFLKRTSTIRDFVKASERLIRQYWNDGYVLAEAEIRFKEFHQSNHEATIHIYEGQIKKTSLKGGDGGIRALLSHYVNLWKNTKPFQTKVLEDYNALTKYIPGFTIYGKISPIAHDPGAGSIELTAQQKKVMAFASMDNRGSKFVGPYRETVGIYAMSILKQGDVSNATLMLTPSKELQYGRLSYVIPLNYSGDSVYIRADYGKVQPGFTVKQDNIVEHDFIFEMLYQHLIFFVPGHQIILKAGLDAFSSDAITPNSRVYADQIREVVLGIADHFRDPFGGKNFTEFRIHQGISELGGTNRRPALRSEPDGRATATRFLGEWIHSHPLPNRFSLVLNVRGQLSLQPLLSSTAFYFGSYPYGSAYDPGEISGDNGLAGRLEGRYAFDTSANFFTKAHAYLFYDGGKVWNRNISAGYKGKSGTSTGIGARFLLYKNYESDFELAKPLTLRLRSALANGTSRPWRLFFKLTARF